MYVIHEIGQGFTAAPERTAGRMLQRVGMALTAWRARRVSQRCLADLDERLLADIGLTRPTPRLEALRLSRME